jgi:hypothetical protein
MGARRVPRAPFSTELEGKLAVGALSTHLHRVLGGTRAWCAARPSAEAAMLLKALCGSVPAATAAYGEALKSREQPRPQDTPKHPLLDGPWTTSGSFGAKKTVLQSLPRASGCGPSAIFERTHQP